MHWRADRLSREGGSFSKRDLCYHQFIMKVFKLIEGLTKIEVPDSDTAPRSHLIGGERERSAQELLSEAGG